MDRRDGYSATKADEEWRLRRERWINLAMVRNPPSSETGSTASNTTTRSTFSVDSAPSVVETIQDATLSPQRVGCMRFAAFLCKKKN